MSAKPEPDAGLRDDREPIANLTMGELKALIFEQIMAAQRPASAEYYQNGKGERTVTIKEYAVDARQANASASAVFDTALRNLPVLGTDRSPHTPLRLTGELRSERE